MQVASEKGGPPRTIFRVQEAFSLRIDLGPDLFKIEKRKLPAGGPLRLSSKLPSAVVPIAEQVSGRKKISVTEGVLHLDQLNVQLEALDRQRDALIALHQQIRGRISAAVDSDFENYSQRTMVHALIETPRIQPDLGLMAKELQLSEKDISAVMTRVRELVERQRSDRSGEVVAISDNSSLRWWLG
jgi:predicted transcriptional regulator